MERRDSQLSALEWKKKYLHVEAKLKQFRIQAVNVRAKLGQKMEELTYKLEQAEARSADSERQLTLLRNCIAGVPGAQSAEAEYNRNKITELEEKCQEQAEKYMKMEKELEYEKSLRALEKKSLHDKAIRIKAWVSSTLTTMEEEKSELQESNTRLNAAVQSMQKRITELLNEASSQPKGTETKVSTECSPDRDDPSDDAISSPTSPTWQSNPLFENKPHKTDTNDNAATLLLNCSTAMELDHNESNSHDVTYASIKRKDDAPTGNCDEIGNVMYKMDDKEAKSSALHRLLPNKQRTTTVKSVGDPELLSKNKEDAQKFGKKSSTLPMPRSIVSPTVKNSSSASPTHHHLMETFGSIRRKFKGLTEHQKQKSSDESIPTSKGRGRHEKNRSKSPSRSGISTSKYQTSPIAMSGSTHSSTGEGGSKEFVPEDGMVVDAVPLLSSSLPVGGVKSCHSNLPPVLPHHGIPAWESKIYEVAKNGFKISNNLLEKSYKYPSSNTGYEYAEFVHKQLGLSVPVYSRIKGRAILIRSSGFTDSSDTSDDDLPSYPPSPLRHASPRHAARPSRSLTGSIDLATQQRRNGSPGLNRSLKRANSRQSVASSEGDYAIPPDAQTNSSTPSCDSSEPDPKLFKTSKNSSTSSVVGTRPTKSQLDDAYSESDAEVLKSGYLSKLGGKSKTWKTRWFVLKNRKLLYYSSPSAMKKPNGEINLGGNVTITTTDANHATAFQIVTNGRHHYLTAESLQCANEWKIVLQNVAKGLDNATSISGSISGWLTRTIGGSSCRTWAVMRNDAVEFFESSDKNEQFLPFDIFPLQSCSVEDVQLNIHGSTNTGHTRYASPPALDHVIVIRPISESGPDVFLSFETEMQKSSWLRCLRSICRSSLSRKQSQDKSTPFCEQSEQTSVSTDQLLVTEFERLVMKLFQSKPTPSRNVTTKSLWRNPVLSYSVPGINRPLTSLSSNALRTEAIKVAKAIQLFTQAEIDASSIDYHIKIAQRICKSCLTHEELRNEVFSQLIKVTNRRDAEVTDNSDNSYLQAWKLLALIIPIFLPTKRILWLLREHLKRKENPKSEVGNYVTYCQQCAERTAKMGGRTASPSRIESASVLLHNPIQHSLPFSFPVHFADGSYQVTSFDASTTAEELMRHVTLQSGLRHHTMSGFSLYVDHPDVSISLKHSLDPTMKICDVISSWETVLWHIAVTKKGSLLQSGSSSESSKSPKFIFQQRLHHKGYEKMETEKERILLVYQTADVISRDLFPISRDLAAEMTSLMCQIHHGNYSSSVSLDQMISHFHPLKYRGKRQQKAIIDRWMALEGAKTSDCARIFLTTMRKWPFCHNSIFLAKNETGGKPSGEVVWLNVGEDCLSVLNCRTMEVIDRYLYTDLMTFGGCKDHMMLVTQIAGVCRKIFYSMKTIEMLEMIGIIRDYMNSSLIIS